MTSIGYQRPLRLCNHLSRNGVDVTVYAGHPAWAPIQEKPDTRLNGLIDARIEVLRIPSLHPIQWALNLRADLLAPRRAAQEAAQGAAQGTSRADAAAGPIKRRPSLLVRLVDAILPSLSVPDRYWGWVFTVLPILLLRILWRRPDCIFATAPPWTPLVLATLAGRLTGVPVYVDYRDPWNFNPYHKGPRNRLSLRLEAWVLEHARGILTNTQSMAECYAQAFPRHSGKITAVYNGIDAATVAQMNALRAASVKKTGPFTVSHIGTLYRHRMPARLADVLAEAARSWKGERGIRFRFVGWVEDTEVIRAAFASRGCAHMLELAGQLPAWEARQEQMDADVLLLLQSGTALQIPAKVFEYALAEKPLLCFADAGSETGQLVEKYELGMLCTDEVEFAPVLQYLEEILKNSWQFRKLQDFMRDFDGEKHSRSMAELLFPK